MVGAFSGLTTLKTDHAEKLDINAPMLKSMEMLKAIPVQKRREL